MHNASHSFYAVAPCGLIYGPPCSFEKAQAVVVTHRLSPDEEGWHIVPEDQLQETLAEIDANLDAQYRARMAAYGVEVH
jgi:hypothetical protein